MPVQKLSAQNNDWTKKDIQKKLHDFSNISLAGPESAIVTKRNLLLLQFYYKTGTMGRFGSTKLVLPKWLSYGTLNRVIRVCTNLCMC